MNNIKQKSEYCLNCKLKPCSLKGCPLNNDIPEYINAVKQEQYKKAYGSCILSFRSGQGRETK